MVIQVEEVKIVSYSPEFSEDFKRVNEEWIEDMFEMEEADRRVLDSPQEMIIEEGGVIILAKHPQLGIIGACALLKKDDKTYELTKMGVLKRARGLKAGEKLLQSILHLAEEMKIETLFLLTNKKCEAAIHLYLKFGFRHDKGIKEKYGPIYQRANVAMKYFPA